MKIILNCNDETIATLLTQLVETFTRIEGKVDLILSQNRKEKVRDRNMSVQLDALTREVEESRTVTESAISLIAGLAQQIRDAATDPAALQALADSLDAQQTALSAAISANTTPTP